MGDLRTGDAIVHVYHAAWRGWYAGAMVDQALADTSDTRVSRGARRQENVTRKTDAKGGLHESKTDDHERPMRGRADTRRRFCLCRWPIWPGRDRYRNQGR